MASEKTVTVKILVHYDEKFGEGVLGDYVTICDAAEVKFEASVVVPTGAHDLAGMICSDLRPWLEDWKRRLAEKLGD